MKTIYIVRHGESESNVGGVISGGDKIALTEHGREQAAFVGERLSHLPVDIIVTSTYLRAKQTGEVIAEKIGKPIEHSELFIEWRHGSHRIGKRTHDPELRERSKSLVEHLDEPEYRIADEENFADLNERAEKALQYLLDRTEEHIVVVSHGWFTPVLLGKAVMEDDFTGRDCKNFIKGFTMKNTGLTILAHGETYFWNKWHVVTWNDHAHLG